MKHIREHIDKTIDEMVAIRHQIHENPELGFNEHKTGDKVASLLESWHVVSVKPVLLAH